MDCFLFIFLFDVLIFYPKVNCPSSRTLEMREILRVFHRKRAVGMCNSPNRFPRPASYFRARAGKERRSLILSHVGSNAPQRPPLYHALAMCRSP